MLEDELLRYTKVELNLEIEADGDLIWQAGAYFRAIITKMQLFVLRITFNSEGQSLYMSKYLKSHKFIGRSDSSQKRKGNFKISSGINRPRHVFVFIISDANVDEQTTNPFLYNTFSVSTGPMKLPSCHLEVGNGNEYPEVHYTPSTDMTLVYCWFSVSRHSK